MSTDKTRGERTLVWAVGVLGFVLSSVFLFVHLHVYIMVGLGMEVLYLGTLLAW